MKANLFKAIGAVAMIVFLPYCGRSQFISMATSTSLGNSIVFDLLKGKQWSAEPGAEYVKIHLYLDAPIKLKEIELRACEKFDDNVHLFINFDEHNYNLKKKKG